MPVEEEHPLNDLFTRIWNSNQLSQVVGEVPTESVYLRPANPWEQAMQEIEDLKKRVAELEAAQAPGMRFLKKQKAE